MDEYIKREDALDAVLFALCGTGYQSRAIDAIRELPTADVVPKREVEILFFDIRRNLYSKFPHKLRPIEIGGRFIGNSYELGREKMFYEVLEIMDNLEKKYLGG